MKVKISKQELLKGLGDMERIVLKRYALQDFYYFEGLPTEGYTTDGMKLHPKAMEYAKNYPELMCLTKIEFQIFCAIFGSPQGIHYLELVNYLRNPQSSTQANNICVYISSIRRKLKGFKIETIRSPLLPRGGTYKVINLS